MCSYNGVECYNFCEAINYEFSNQIKKITRRKKLKQQDVADKLGIARTTYASYEQGKREPDHETLVKIADFFGVSLDFLLRDASEDFQDKFFKDEAKKS